MPARRRTDPTAGARAVTDVSAALDNGTQPRTGDLRAATRYLLEELAERVPGRSVEVRVPPYGVAQCVPGLRHTRGTPPNVVEMDATTWIELATGRRTWSDAVSSGRLHASGERSDLSAYLPVI